MSSVMVVDDDESLARALAINLRAHGYQVCLAHTGQSALTEVTRVSPAVIIRASVRRGTPPPTDELAAVTTADFTLDFNAHQVRRRDTVVRLTPTEWSLLEILVRHSGKLVPQQQLLTEIWGPGTEQQTHYLRVYLAQLRRKLEPDTARPRYLITEPGIGYRFQS